ncbi:uncharacterized protein C8A04DRAFT_30117 [Dichotomopilus funicola]|uniref:DUF7726 domain-containing protein n=1 Tax=Dichotomopilus funicola TaxID=1934379 RepID=A0AAN6UZX5_9PEZI|nr:hypothetical protein C8A04DRAFT_30117 [Dichotomopilus funicola]
MAPRAKASSSQAPRGPKRAKGKPDEPFDWREKVMADFRLYTRSSEKLAQNMQAEMMASCWPTAYRFQDVPVKKIVDAVRTFLRWRFSYLRSPYRQKMFENIMAAVPAEFASEAVWEPPPPPPPPKKSKTPFTPFSEPRTKPGEPPKSGEFFFDAFTLAVGFTPRETTQLKKRIIDFEVLVNTGQCAGGCEHDFPDTPACFVRDYIMGYIDSDLPVGTGNEATARRNEVKKAVFSDLTPAEIAQYSILLKKERNAEYREDSPTPPPYDEFAVLRDVDDTLDLAPRTEAIYRFKGPGYGQYFVHSVVHPPRHCSHGTLEFLPVENPERLITIPSEIHYDCDQIRAMIKIFFLERDEGEGGWTLESFCPVIASSRQDLEKFLKHRGPKHYVTSRAYKYAWEFFYRREMMGLPLRGAGPERDSELLQAWAAKQKTPGQPEQTQQTGGKRRSTDDTEDVGNGNKRRKVGDN